MLTILHRARYLELVRDERDRASIEVSCPRCGEMYFAEMGGLEPWEAGAAERAARFRLAEECPDHPHRFELD